MARSASPGSQRNRARIAQVAARLIAEHGLADWSLAKRKACRELGLADNEALPGNEELEEALRNYNTLFRPDAQAASLREQRRLALDWMERLSAWNPLLIGGVAAGWATEHSEVRVELEAEDPKTVELALINGGIDYQPDDITAQSATQLVAGRGARTVRLVIASPLQRRNRPRRDDDARLGIAELKALLEGAPLTAR
ncbi:MAG: UDP-N-acetylmuramate--alanine ligase [Casimicrobiaceae bacterium]